MDIKKFLCEMSESPGISGYEHDLAQKISENCPWADETRSDKLGNLILLKRGKDDQNSRPKIMLAAHMDEIGLMVTKIEKEGFIRFSTVGGFDQRVLLAQEVVVHGKKDLPGVIGAKPPHSLTAEERRRTVSIEDMFIDIGFDSFEKVSQYVNVGDLITIKRDCLSLQGNYITGKAMDDRVGVAVMLECLKELAKREHIADVYAVCTVQEEVGLRGATTSTYGIVPDIGIAIDVGFGDMPGIPEYDSIKMSNGPGITVGPQVHPKLHERMVKTARDWNIPFSPEATPSPGGTDTYAMQVTRSGIPTMLLSVPIRYMHTPVETVDYTDVIRTGRLLALFIAELDHEFLEGLKCF